MNSPFGGCKLTGLIFRAGCELVPRDGNLLVRKLKEIFKHVHVERKII